MGVRVELSRLISFMSLIEVDGSLNYLVEMISSRYAVMLNEAVSAFVLIGKECQSGGCTNQILCIISIIGLIIEKYRYFFCYTES